MRTEAVTYSSDQGPRRLSKGDGLQVGVEGKSPTEARKPGATPLRHGGAEVQSSGPASGRGTSVLPQSCPWKCGQQRPLGAELRRPGLIADPPHPQSWCEVRGARRSPGLGLGPGSPRRPCRGRGGASPCGRGLSSRVPASWGGASPRRAPRASDAYRAQSWGQSGEPQLACSSCWALCICFRHTHFFLSF